VRQRGLAFALVAVAPATAIGLLLVTGGLGPGLPGLPDPGRVTRIGLPFTQALRDLAAMATVGMLVLAVACVWAPDGMRAGRLHGPSRRLVDLAGRIALLWAGLGMALIALTFSDVSGSAFGTAGFVDQVLFFAHDYELGQYLLWSSVLAMSAGLLALTAASVRVAGLAAVIAMAALWPMALNAHGAGTLRHDLAVDAQAAHLLGVAVWAGGLFGLVVVRGSLGDRLGAAVRRYSSLAGWCFALVAVAGVAGAVIRIERPAALASDYGVLLLLKIAAAALLGLLGLQHRRRMAGLIESRGAAVFRRMVVVEAVVMAAAAGTAVALNRTPPPASSDARIVDGAEDFLGYPVPDRLHAVDWFTAWQVDGFWLPVALVGVLLYVAGAMRLRRRGDRWPVGRTIAWVLGWTLFVWATSGAPGAYGRVLFSMHMVQHMTIATTVPVLLVLGAPVTLALRTLRRRADGSMGPREWTLAIVHSPVSQLLSHPLVAAGNFIVSLVVFYYSGLFPLALETHTGHVLMTAHFLVSGYFFAGCLVGIDPGLRQPDYPLRVLMVMVTFGFHSLFSVTLMASSRILAEGWFVSVRPSWAASLADDQYLGASLGWALGDYPLALLAGLLVFSWVRSDQLDGARFDRQEERDGGRQLAAYNAYLSGLGPGRTGTSAHDPRGEQPGDS
jgi:cytochrome c oxidase assembly factor CtaG/putative copper export protein